MNTYKKQQLIEKIDSLQDLYQATGGTDPLTLYEQFSYILLAHIALTCSGDTPELPYTLSHVCDRERLSERIVIPNNEIYRDMIFQISQTLDGLADPVDIQIANSDIFSLALDVIHTVIPLNSEAYPDEDIKFLLKHLLDTCLSKSRDAYFGTSSSLAAFVLEAADQVTPQDVYDPACGTGVFLIAAGQKYGRLRSIGGNERNAQLRKIAQLNMLFFGLQADIYGENDIAMANWRQDFDFVLANPPFNASTVDDAEFRNIDIAVQTRHRYRIFIQILLKKIRRGGSGAIIVPNSFLLSSNRDVVLIRQWLLANYFVEGIIGLPANTFYPKANVNASVIIVTATYRNTIDPDAVIPMLESPQAPKSRAAEAKDFTALLELWRDKDALATEWSSQMERGQTMNLHGAAAPAGWTHVNIWFASMKDIQELDYCLLPKQYQPAGAFRESLEEPQSIIREIIDTERQILTALEALEQELHQNG